MGLIVKYIWKQRISELSLNQLWHSLGSSLESKGVSLDLKKRHLNDEIQLKIFELLKKYN
jgi:hypothetical protein